MRSLSLSLCPLSHSPFLSECLPRRDCDKEARHAFGARRILYTGEARGAGGTYLCGVRYIYYGCAVALLVLMSLGSL